MRRSCCILRVLIFLFLCGLGVPLQAYLSRTVPCVHLGEVLSRVWEETGTETRTLGPGEYVTERALDAEHDLAYAFRFRLGEGSSLRWHDRCYHATFDATGVTLGEIHSALPLGEGVHRVEVGSPVDPYLLLDGQRLELLPGPAGKGFELHNAGQGEIELSDWLLERPTYLRKGLPPREAPRTAEELLARTKVWARYFIYSEAPPPRTIRPQGER